MGGEGDEGGGLRKESEASWKLRWLLRWSSVPLPRAARSLPLYRFGTLEEGRAGQGIGRAGCLPGQPCSLPLVGFRAANGGPRARGWGSRGFTRAGVAAAAAV